eukprot:jgi/Ulvmu1/1742/UM117_0019.1
MLSRRITTGPVWTAPPSARTWPHAVSRDDVVAHAKKKAGKKKKSKPSGDETVAAQAGRAPRIGLNDSMISVRKQIHYVRLKEQQEKEKAREVARAKQNTTSFRRAGMRQQVEANSRMRQEARKQEQQLAQRRFRKAWSPGIESLYGTKGQAGAPVLVVDGYNVMLLLLLRNGSGGRRGRRRVAASQPHTPPAAPPASHMLEPLTSDSDSGSSSEDEVVSHISGAALGEERVRLEDRLRGYSVAVQARVVVVWDGMGFAGTSTWQAGGFAVEEREDLTVVYTQSMEADTLIARAAKELVARGAYHALVVTSDAEVQAMAAAPGVFPVSADEFARRLRDAEAQQRAQEREAQARVAGVRASQGTGGAGGVLAGVVAGGGEALELQAMMAGFENGSDYLRAEEAGLTALQFYKAPRRQERGPRPEARQGNGASRTDHDRRGGRRRRGRGAEEGVAVDVEFAPLSQFLQE